MKYVIIGNGTAGLSAAEEIRKIDKSSKIIMISEEQHLTYYRIKLTEAISKDFSDKQLFVRDREWYGENDVELMLETRVEAIDTLNKQLKLKDSGTLSYDKLLIATGGRSFIPPIDGNEKTGVFALRSLDDLEEIKKYLEKCETVTVLGGGLLGLEAAWAIKKLGKKVHVVEFFPQLLPRQLDKETSMKFGDMLKEKGLNLHLGVSAKEMIGENSVNGVKLSDNTTIETDLVLISAGVRPRLEIIEDTDIEFDKGIKVDQFMKTNIDDVYAAGDAIEVDGRVIGLWGIASEQGKVAAENMTGSTVEYKLPKLTTILRIADSSIFSAGNIEDYDIAVEQENEEDNTRYRLCVTDGKITGGVIFNDMNKALKIKKAIEQQIDIAEHLEENVTVLELLDII